MKTQYRIALFFGGRSPEHEVSLHSANNVMRALADSGHTVCPVGIHKDGTWHLYPDLNSVFTNPDDPVHIALRPDGKPVTLLPDYRRGGLLEFNGSKKTPIDICFPLIHGSQGEDGTIQGLLEMSGYPYVGAGVLGMAVTLDKIVMKDLFSFHNLATPAFIAFNSLDFEKKTISYDRVVQAVGSPFFVKPSNTGSSVGVHKVKSSDQFSTSLEDAFRYDTRVLCEEAINCREIELSVLGNDDPRASLPGEVIPRHEFYSYEAKYVDPNGADLVIPAKLEKSKIQHLQTLAIQAYKACCMSGMARADFFFDKTSGNFLINELNSVPGFTNISMYPKLWEATGLSYGDLLENLIALGFERHQQRTRIVTNNLSLKIP